MISYNKIVLSEDFIIEIFCVGVEQNKLNPNELVLVFDVCLLIFE
jgi:hypothetical protein